MTVARASGQSLCHHVSCRRGGITASASTHLAHARVANEQQFEQVVVAVGHGVWQKYKVYRSGGEFGFRLRWPAQQNRSSSLCDARRGSSASK